MLLASLLLLSSPVSEAAGRLDCRGAPVATCPAAWTGPACDLPCDADACDYSLYCHGDGATYGLSSFGARLFAADPREPDWLVRLRLLRFVAEHAGDLGLAAGLGAGDLGLSAAPTRVDVGALRLLRFRQSWREWPLFGADATVTLVADRAGVIGLRGAIVDGRDDYAHASAPARREVAEASILAHAAARARVPAAELRVEQLRLVAVRRARAIAWAASVFHGAARLASVVVAADPSADPLPLLHHTDAAGTSLGDELALTVRAEDLASDLYAAPIESASYPIAGSLADGAARLADRAVVVIDAGGAVSQAQAVAGPIVGQLGTSFDAWPGTREFGFQSSYYLLRSFYALTDAVMHGRWDSTLPLYGRESAVPPGEFAPRLVAAADPAVSLCSQDASWCVRSAWAGEGDELPAEALRHPTDAPPYEPVGAMYLKGSSYSPAILPHEFGHFVDMFAAPGLMFEPFACSNCSGTCHPGTTDESLPLTETYASLLALWYYRSLYPGAGESTSCDTLRYLSSGENRNPHNEACRPSGESISLFVADDDPDCQNNEWDYPDLCDRPGLENLDLQEWTGLCERTIGYMVDSHFQAFWELLHGESCSPSPPFACHELPALTAASAPDVIGAALLYAAQVNTSTYRGLADDVATHVACNHGEAAYLELNEVLCHHRIRECDAPVPTLCDFCGDGVRSGRERCDGGDLGGSTCASLGLTPGDLACDAACDFDVSGCMSPGTGSESTTSSSGGQPGAPTTEPPTGDGPATSSSDGSPEPWGLFIDPAATGGEAAEDGCACAATGPSVPWLAGLLLPLRRRRRPR